MAVELLAPAVLFNDVEVLLLDFLVRGESALALGAFAPAADARVVRVARVYDIGFAVGAKRAAHVKIPGIFTGGRQQPPAYGGMGGIQIKTLAGD